MKRSARAKGTTAAVSKKRAYHHGDLRRALIEAAATLAAQRGIAGVSMREIGRTAGVSHAAPYHHFPSREALLAAVAEEGFRRLDAAHEEALRNAGSDPRERLRAIGIAYVRFAVRNPHYFRVMFKPEVRERGVYPDLDEVATRTFDRVVDTVRAYLVYTGSPSVDPVRPSILCWSTVHGLASLWLDGPLPAKVGGAAQFETIADWVATNVVKAITPESDPSQTP